MHKMNRFSILRLIVLVIALAILLPACSALTGQKPHPGRADR